MNRQMVATGCITFRFLLSIMKEFEEIVSSGQALHNCPISEVSTKQTLSSNDQLLFPGALPILSVAMEGPVERFLTI